MGKYITLFDTVQQYNEYRNSPSFVKPNVSHCINEGTVHYTEYNPYNGHEYVDLGLPSGTKWATMNVGAASINDGGLYFAIGETHGYTRSEVLANTRLFNEESWNVDGHLNKYFVDCTDSQLDLDDDAAHAYMGGDWHMPNREQIIELTNNVTVTHNENVGFTLTSTINGNSIFFPYTGQCFYYASQNKNYIGSENQQSHIYLSTVEHIDDYDNDNNIIGQHGTEMNALIYFNGWSNTSGISYSSGPYGLNDGYGGCAVRGVVG